MFLNVFRILSFSVGFSLFLIPLIFQTRLPVSSVSDVQLNVPLMSAAMVWNVIMLFFECYTLKRQNSLSPWTMTAVRYIGISIGVLFLVFMASSSACFQSYKLFLTHKCSALTGGLVFMSCQILVLIIVYCYEWSNRDQKKEQALE